LPHALTPGRSGEHGARLAALGAGGRPRSGRPGRDPGADIVLADSRVSWQHAMIWAENGIWLVEDGGSRNGTYAGG